VLTFHDHRHGPQMSFTAVFGIDVLQHSLSRQRAWVACVLFEVLDSLFVTAGQTGESRTFLVFPDAVPHNWSVYHPIRKQCDAGQIPVTNVGGALIHLLLVVGLVVLVINLVS